MNICLLNDSFPPVIDGVANTVMNYARVITAEGHEAIVATPRYPDADYSGYPYRVVPYQSFNISNLVQGYRAGNPLAMGAINELVAFRPSLIHTHCPVSSTVMARILRNETGAPVVFTYHTKFDEDIAKAVSSKALQEAGERVLVDNITACDEVWTVSRGAGENLKSLGYEGDYRVVVNGVDFPRGRTSEEEAFEVTKAFDLPAGIPVFLFVGRLMTYKGLPLIIDAVKILSDEGVDYRMVFIGGGVDADVIREQALISGLRVDSVQEDGSILSEGDDADRPGKVIFTGPIRDRECLRAWNTRAHLFLFPSTYDTNGIVVREAAACGLASVLIAGSCAAEDITDGRNGFLIEETPEAMAKVLAAVCRDPAAAREVGKHAMDEIYLSWDDSVRRAIGYYEEIIKNKEDGVYDSRKKVVSDRMITAAAHIDEVGRILRGTPRNLWETQKSLAVSTKQTTKRLLGKPKALYRGMRNSIHGGMQASLGMPRALYEGMQENFVDFIDEVKDGFKEVKEDIRGWRNRDDE